MTLKPRGLPHSEPEHPFTDREPAIEAFARALDELPALGKGHRVLDFHGVAGVGKSDLLLRRLLPMARDRKDRVCWLKLDFENREHRQRPQALFELRKQAFARFKADCPRFDLAYLIWFGKSNPHLLLNEKQFSLGAEGGLAAGILSQAGELAWTGLLPNIGTCVRRLGGSLKQWWTQRGESMLRKLADMEAHAIESELHRYLAAELSQALKVCPNDAVRARVEGRRTSERFLVVFLDTFEAFGRDAGPRTDGRTRESWVRELVQELPGALWVLLGRDRLTWQDDDEDWKDVVEAHDLEEFLPEDAEQFLHGCGVADPALIQAITKLSTLPFYLDISVKTWERLRAGVAEGGREPAPEVFAGTPDEVLDRFVRNYLDQNEKPLLCRLALARFWDRDLGLALIEHFHFGPLRDALDELKRYSFVKHPAPGRHALHELMAQALERELSPEARRETHEFLFEHYESQLKGLTPETVDAVKQRALGEAFFHKTKIEEARECLLWLEERAEIFLDAWAYEGLLPVWGEAVCLAREAAGHGDPADLRNLPVVLGKCGDVYAALGGESNLERARELYEESLKIRRSLVSPSLPGSQRDLSVSLEKCGDVYAALGGESNLDRARELYEESLKIRRSLVSPSLPGSQRDLSVSLNNCGDVYAALGGESNLDRARELYEEGLEIARALASPSLPGSQRDLSVSLEKCGDVCVALGGESNLERARELYEESLEIRRALSNPSLPNSLWDLCVSLERCGDVLLAKGDDASLHHALKLYEESQQYHRKLAESGLPGNKRGLFVVLTKCGDAYAALGGESNLDRARELYEESLEICRGLVSPSLPGSQRDLSISLNNCGDVYVALGGESNLERARELYEESLEIDRALVSPSLPDSQRDLSVSLNKCGDVCVALGGESNLDRAREFYEESLEIRRGLISPSLPGSQRDLSISLNNCGDVYVALGGESNLERAREFYEESLKIRRGLVSPSLPGSQRDLSVSLTKSAQVLVSLGGEANLNTALQRFSESLNLFCQLATPRIAQSIYDVRYVLDLLTSLLETLDNSPTQIDPALLEDAKRQAEAARELLDSLPASQ